MDKDNLRTSMKKPVIPTFWLGLSPKAGLSAKEIYKAFGYSSTTAMAGSISRGSFPSPDLTCQRLSPHRNNAFDNRWKVSTILKEAKRRIALFDDAN